MQELMTQPELAKLLRLSERTLQEWRARGRGPAFIRISKNEVRYLTADVHKWIGERRSTPEEV